MYHSFHIHGDNIVECERALELIKQALSESIKTVSKPQFSVACPRYELHLSNRDQPIAVTFYPGFGRWEHDILDSIRERGGLLREAADVIVTGVNGGAENPLFAIEFCGALPAGNQAWQRSGRAFSFGAAKVPYLYISELGGYELDSNRNRKAPRMPNPAVPFSYLSFSIKRDTPVFPIFITAPGADKQSRQTYNDEFADGELAALVRALLLQENVDDIFERLQLKVLSFVKKRGDSARKGETLSGTQWQEAFESLSNPESLTGYLIDNIRQPWSKTAYIDALTNNAKQLMQLGNKYGIGITSTKLPMCLLDSSSRQDFALAIKQIYPDLNVEFLSWLSRNESLAICWIMGFKPRGDDARPDRGLPPLTRMLIGPDHDMLTIVYGPAPQATWSLLDTNPGLLAQRNGLWEAILETSDALLIEAATDNISRKGYIRAHWETELPETELSDFFVPPKPTRLGENDVDTALHLLLSRLSGENIFEGMCNPPGGDWSGVSILDPDTEVEFRWISLPRVSGPKTKRPDHVFQIFGIRELPIVLSIESKETAQSVENGIGPRLSAYLEYLLNSPASIARPFDQTCWEHSNQSVDIDDYIFVSAAAFIAGNPQKTTDAIARSKTDLTFVVEFFDNGQRCDVEIWTTSEIGNEIALFLKEQENAYDYIDIKVRNPSN